MLRLFTMKYYVLISLLKRKKLLKLSFIFFKGLPTSKTGRLHVQTCYINFLRSIILLSGFLKQFKLSRIQSSDKGTKPIRIECGVNMIRLLGLLRIGRQNYQ